MTVHGEKIGTAVASPTKEFFVRMLTRDIELQDAILDLLDNCVDGIVRSGKAEEAHRPYAGFHATIVMSPDHFTIEDNCGGIPIETAKKYAFAMGRPPVDGQDSRGATVGMYGIGMKRAIFKLGTEALVESYHDTGFIVEFTQKWMAEDKWDDLPMYELSSRKFSERGTRIEVHELNQDVKASFADEQWIEDFRKVVARHYSLIIAKGFSVCIGSKLHPADKSVPIVGEAFKLLQADPAEEGGNRIVPYLFVGTLGDVQVEIFAGLYRELLTKAEAEEEEETRGSSDDAGWTVACNDRVVIWKDKTRLTGWGESTVPNYHGQFIAITGIVMLRSNDPKKLPLTTTKRGIDAASNLYSEVKELMRESTKNLTSFTNKWKRFPDQLESIYKSSVYVDLPQLRELSKTLPMNISRKLTGIKKYEPRYPEPSQARTSARVTFVAEKQDVTTLAHYFFESNKVKPGEVGEAAFYKVLDEAKAKQ